MTNKDNKSEISELKKDIRSLNERTTKHIDDSTRLIASEVLDQNLRILKELERISARLGKMEKKL